VTYGTLSDFLSHLNAFLLNRLIILIKLLGKLELTVDKSRTNNVMMAVVWGLGGWAMKILTILGDGLELLKCLIASIVAFGGFIAMTLHLNLMLILASVFVVLVFLIEYQHIDTFQQPVLYSSWLEIPQVTPPSNFPGGSISLVARSLLVTNNPNSHQKSTENPQASTSRLNLPSGQKVVDVLFMKQSEYRTIFLGSSTAIHEMFARRFR
jgi:hypothetical protein